MDEHEDLLGGVEHSRRQFFKKLLAVGFAVPVISSFALDGLASASEDPHFPLFPPTTSNITKIYKSNISRICSSNITRHPQWGDPFG